jgi:hypothetical protein
MCCNACHALALRITGPGLPLQEAERIAGLVILWLVLLCAMTGCTVVLPGVPEEEPAGVLRYPAPIGSGTVFPGTPGAFAGFVLQRLR